MTSGIRERHARLFPGEDLILVDRADEMGRVFNRLGPQRPATCGAFALSYLFPALGLLTHGAHDLTAEDYLAHLAAVIVEEDEIPASAAVGRRVEAGELTEAEALEAFASIWYRYPVRSSSDPVQSGTSPTGIARATWMASTGQLSTVPVAARTEDGTVQLTSERWNQLLTDLAARVEDWRWHAIFNYQSDQLFKPDGPSFNPANLQSSDAASRIPLDDWGVGHFVGLAGLWRMRGTGAWWLLLLDTYKHRGFEGYQPQPAELMRRGIVRTDGRGGGLLLVVPTAVAADVALWLRRREITPRMWSNGSPEPTDWTWTEIPPRSATGRRP